MPVDAMKIILALCLYFNYLVIAEAVTGQSKHFGYVRVKTLPSPFVYLPVTANAGNVPFFLPLPAGIIAATRKKTRDTQWRDKTKCVNQAGLCRATSRHDDPPLQRHYRGSYPDGGIEAFSLSGVNRVSARQLLRVPCLIIRRTNNPDSMPGVQDAFGENVYA